MVSAITKQNTSISLREIDYTITNYSNNNKVSYVLKNGTMFNMYMDYKRQLRGYSKKCFDPFCRRQRIFIFYGTKECVYLEKSDEENYRQRDDGMVTTIGQLAFFRWAILNEVLDYCFANKSNIVAEMDFYNARDNSAQKIKQTTVGQTDVMVRIDIE